MSHLSSVFFRVVVLSCLCLCCCAGADGAAIPEKFSREAAKPVSPPLEWSNVPPNTVSFVLLVHDANTALQKKTDEVLHWMAFNIPGTARSLPEGVPIAPKLPDGTIQIKNRGDENGYRSPGAPANGPDHHYIFELFALDTKLDLGPDATRAAVTAAMEGHIVGKGVHVGRFHRRS